MAEYEKIVRKNCQRTDVI